MRNKIFGAIGILWGGFMTIHWLMGKTTSATLQADAAYTTGYMVGQWAAHIFGLVLLIAGIYYLFKKPKSAP
jgi:hypothetical protein